MTKFSNGITDDDLSHLWPVSCFFYDLEKTMPRIGMNPNRGIKIAHPPTRVTLAELTYLPEINNQQVGWVIPVPKDTRGEAIYATNQDRQTLSTAIRQGLELALREIFSEPEGIAVKGKQAIEQIREKHSPAERVVLLRQIYSDALSAEIA